MHILRLTLIALLLTGCAAANIGSDYSLANRLEKGVLVMSITYSHDAPVFSLSFRNVATNVTNVIMSDTKADPEDWKDPAGRLVALELPAGKYEIFNWQGGSYGSRRPFSIPYTIVEGKATYIGNVHVNVLWQLQMFQILVADESDRDIPLFLTKFNNIKETDIIKSISTIN